MKRCVLLICLLLPVFQNLIANGIRTENDTTEVKSLNLQGFEMRWTDPKQSIADATKALAMAKVDHYQSGVEESYRIMGIGYYYLNQPVKALAEYSVALKFAIHNKDLKGQAKIYNNLGNLYSNEHDDKALSFFKKALQISSTLKDSDDLAKINLNIGNFYTKKGSFYLAINFYKKSSTILKTPMILILSSENLGFIYFKLKQFNKAKSFLLTARKKAAKTNLSESTIDADLLLAVIYINQGNVTKASEILKEGLLLSFVIKDEKIEKEFKDKLQDIQHISKKSSSGTFKQINDILLYAQLNDQLIQAEKSKSEEIQSFHTATEKLVKQKESDKSEILAKNKIIQLQYLIGGGMAIFLSVLILLGCLFYRQYRLNRTLELEKMRTNIAADFHDELGSTLSSIALYCEIALADNLEDKKRSRTLLASIHQSSLRTVSAMKDMIWSLQSDNDNTTEVIYRMRDYAVPLADLKGMNLSFDVAEDMQHQALSMNIKKNIYLIFKESINNAFKYSSAKNIMISLKRDVDKLELKITDDGVGFDLQSSKKGYGILNIYKRAEQSGGTLKINSRMGEGTAILFCCKIT